MNAATVLLEIILFSAFRKWGAVQTASIFSWKELFHLVFMIRGQIDWSPFVFKVARYSFLGSIPSKFEHKLRRQKQSFGKIATTVVLDKEDENLNQVEPQLFCIKISPVQAVSFKVMLWTIACMQGRESSANGNATYI